MFPNAFQMASSIGAINSRGMTEPFTPAGAVRNWSLRAPEPKGKCRDTTEPGANPRCRYYPGVQSGGILCHRAQRRELFSIGPSHPAAGCIGFSTMATAINAMRVPDTLATPTRACVGGIGSRVDAEGAARVRFPIFPRDPRRCGRDPSRTVVDGRNLGSRSAAPMVAALSSSAGTSTTPGEPRRAARVGRPGAAGGRR